MISSEHGQADRTTTGGLWAGGMERLGRGDRRRARGGGGAWWEAGHRWRGVGSAERGMSSRLPLKNGKWKTASGK